MQKYLLTSLTLLIFTQLLLSQGLEPGNDPFGKPYRPRVGILKSLIHESVPNDLGEKIASKFADGMGYSFYGNTPYELLDKSKLVKTEELVGAGATWQDLWRYYREAAVGCQYLFRVEVNSWELANDQDSIFTRERKFVKIANYKVGNLNMTVRLTDVATSKILIYQNIDLTATTKGYDGKFGETDSMKVVNQLYAQAIDKAKMMFIGYLPAVSTVKSLHEEDKGKARSVLLNDAPLTTFCPKNDIFNTYAISKFYNAGGQTFAHADYAGKIAKANDYTFKFPKFEVHTGKKEIAEKLNEGATLVVSRWDFPPGTFTPSNSRTSLVLDNFTNSTLTSQRNVRILQDGCMEVLSRFPQLIDVVDREIYDMIKKEQSIQQQMKSDATQAGIGIGGQLVLTADIVNFSKNVSIEYDIVTKEEEQKAAEKKTGDTKKAAPAKSETQKTEEKDKKAPAKGSIQFGKSVPKNYNYTTTATVNVKIISVATGEVVFTNSYSVSGGHKIPATEKDRFNMIQAEEKSFRNMTERLGKGLWADIQYHVTPKLFLLDVNETDKKGEAESFIIGGGLQGGLLPGMSVEAVALLEEEVDGQKLTRDAVIGELKIRNVYPATSIAKVKNGGREIQEKLAAGAKIYCRLVRG